MASSASIRITGDVSQALASLEALGIKAEETGAKTEEAFGDKLAGSLENTGGVFGKLGNIVSGLGLPFGETFSKMGEHIESANTEGQKFGAAMQEVGKVATVGLAAGVAVAAGESIHLAENYQTATASIAAHAGITQQAADAIGKAFLSTAGSSTFSAQEIATAYAPVAGQLATVEGHALTSGQALQAMKASMDLAEGSGTSLGTATSALASVMQAFHIQTQGASTASDVLFNVATMTATGVDQVATTVDRLHARLGMAAPSLQDTGALMADLAEHGATGSRGMNVVSSAMTTLLGGSKAVDTELQTLGVHVYDASGKFVGMQSVIAQLGPKLSDLTQQQQAAAEKTLFGSGAAQLMGQVMEGGVTSYNKAADAVSRVGSAHEAAEKQASTFHGTMEKLKATGEDLGVKFGQVLIPVIQRLAAVVADVINWFEKHKAVAEAVGIALAVLVAGPIAMYIGGMIAAAAATVVAAAPIIAIIAVVAAVGVAIYELVTHWTTVWDAIKQGAQAAWNFLKSIFEDGVNFVKAHWKDMVEALLVLVTGGIALVPVLIYRYWSQITQFTSQLWHDVTGFFERMWQDVSGAVSTGVTDVVNFFAQLPGDIWNALGSLLDDMLHFGEQLIQSIINGIGNMAGSVASAIGNTVKSGVNSIPGVGSIAKAIGFAEGGVVTQPTFALLGEGGETEYVIPQSWISTVSSGPGVSALPAPSTGGGGSGGGGGGGDLVIQMNDTEFVRVAGPALRSWMLQGARKNATRVGLS